MEFCSADVNLQCWSRPVFCLRFLRVWAYLLVLSWVFILLFHVSKGRSSDYTLALIPSFFISHVFTLLPFLIYISLCAFRDRPLLIRHQCFFTASFTVLLVASSNYILSTLFLSYSLLLLLHSLILLSLLFPLSPLTFFHFFVSFLWHWSCSGLNDCGLRTWNSNRHQATFLFSFVSSCEVVGCPVNTELVYISSGVLFLPRKSCSGANVSTNRALHCGYRRR